MSSDDDISARRWKAHALRAGLIRSVAFLVPMAASILVGLAVGAVLPVPQTRTATMLWWAAVLASSTLGLYGTDRVTRGLLPLATLLRLSMLFPDRAPSRVKLARRVTGSRAIERELERAGRAGAAGDRQEAAETILSLVGALGDYDSRTRGHSERTQLFVTLLADELKLKAEDKGRLMWAALVHDIGKLRVPHEVLNKPGQPSADEWEILHSHPHQGALICEPLRTWLGEWWYAIEQHHEKYDGSGYPAGLAGAEISYGARIVTVADSYEVMTASRPYKRPITAVAAREELTRCAGSQFDPDVVRAFLNISLGRLSRSAGPIAWIMQVLAVRPGPILGQIIGGVAGAAAAAGAVLGLNLAPTTHENPPDQVVAAPTVDDGTKKGNDTGEPDRRPGLNDGEPNPTEPTPVPVVPFPPVPIVPFPSTDVPDGTSAPEMLGPPAPGQPDPAPGESDPAPGQPDPAPGESDPPDEPEKSPLDPVLPVLTDDYAAGPEDTGLTVDVLANDTPGDSEPLRIAGLSQPSHGSVAQVGGGALSYQPEKDFHGSDAVTYRVRLSDGSMISAGLSLTVEPVNDAPEPVGDNALIAEDAVATPVSVLGNDIDVDGDLLQVVDAGVALHGAVQLVGGKLSYIPNPGYNGPDAFVYTVSDDSGATATATVDIVVMPGNDLPVAADDAVTVLEDAADAVVDVLGNDSDVDGDSLTVTAVTAPSNGTSTLQPDGTVTYRPDPDFFGADSFGYTISDGNGGTATATVSVAVTAVDDPPVAAADTLFTDEDTSLPMSALLKLNDSDPDGGSLTVISVTGAANGNLTESTPGVWTYTPDQDFYGTETLTYDIADPQANTASAAVTIDVAAVNDAPSAGPDAYATTPGILTVGPAAGLLSNDSDVDNAKADLRVIGFTTGASSITSWNADGSFSTISLLPGTHTFAYTVADNAVPSAGWATGSMTITVSTLPTRASSLYLQPSSTSALGSMGTSAAPAGATATQPNDYELDTHPGLTIKSGGDKLDGTDVYKYQTWAYPAGGLDLNGPVSMTLWTSLEGKTTQDLDYSAWLLDCAPSAVSDVECAVLASTDKIHVDDWNVTAGWEQRTVTIGSVSATLAGGHTLRLRLGFNHADVWLAMDDQHRSALNLTVP